MIVCMLYINCSYFLFSPPMPTLPTLSISSQSLIKNVLIIVGYLFKENKKYLSDYRIALLRTTTMARPKDVCIIIT